MNVSSSKVKYLPAPGRLASEYIHRCTFAVYLDTWSCRHFSAMMINGPSVVGDFEAPHTGLIFVVPVLRVRGLRRHSQA
jgi:hypothetical protein